MHKTLNPLGVIIDNETGEIYKTYRTVGHAKNGWRHLDDKKYHVEQINITVDSFERIERYGN
ncbi:hypothetical protein [Weissella cibaria]|uniref:hypothetical protein n=1 Tax=Weissella cibaria TaxID=137591 RepID=UPI0013DBE60C|nr:hypothetical protein [Weissella cibaria]NFA02970.1 hypothetical protein [Weissella cibaria]